MPEKRVKLENGDTKQNGKNLTVSTPLLYSGCFHQILGLAGEEVVVVGCIIVIFVCLYTVTVFHLALVCIGYLW